MTIRNRVHRDKGPSVTEQPFVLDEIGFPDGVSKLSRIMETTRS